MNIASRIDGRLWDAIRNSFDNRNFTGSIQDSIYFMSDLIRERSGLEGDGASLVGAAFGGPGPILKVNSLKTDNDKNIQKGIEQILRGLYQSIRNPRSHEKYSDTEEDAVSIILFINYIIKIIDKSKTPFLEKVFISRVIDPSFVPNTRYAELLVDEIPDKKRMDIFYGVLDKCSDIDGEKLKFFFNALFNKLSEDDKKEIYNAVSNVLKTEDETGTVRTFLQAFSDIWQELDEVARLRIENKLLDAIKDGALNPKNGQCKSGAFGTWASAISKHFLLKRELLNIIEDKFESSRRVEQNYVFKFFSGVICEIAEKPSSRLKRIITSGLKNGDFRFKELVVNYFIWPNDNWHAPFKELIDTFEIAPLPYDQDYDYEPPF